jgi:hypothetical protein
MKLPAILLATITAAVVISSCSKGVDTNPPKGQSGTDSTNGGGNHPGYCPACGMG